MKQQRVAKRVEAAGLSRVLNQHMRHGPFGILSAWKGNVAENPELLKENRQRDVELRKLVRSMGYGFIPLYGLYEYEGPSYGSGVASEDSIFIPGISLSDISQLAEKMEQESFIWGDDGRWALYNTATGQSEPPRNVLDDFALRGEGEQPPYASSLHPIDLDQQGLKQPRQVWQLDPFRETAASRQWFYSVDLDRSKPPANIKMAGIKEASSANAGFYEALIPLRKASSICEGCAFNGKNCAAKEHVANIHQCHLRVVKSA